VRHILDVFGMVLDGGVAQVCSRSSTKRDSFICIGTNLHTSSVLIIVT
jgi:NAD-dependent SIR2 family protein deacetylase